MARQSAGLLMFREPGGGLEVLLVHPGGPYWTNKDDGAWSIPKGGIGDGEEPLAAARREFAEETGLTADGPLLPLEPVRQRGGKVVHAWAMRGDCDAATLHSNSFTMEWPPRSGRQQDFPEVDRAAWLPIEAAKHKILAGQLPLLLELQAKLAAGHRA
jgi:predicted NUDIX family NTP pyrophosphohydrolase